MEIIVTANPNNLIAFADLNCGQVFRMVNADDVRRFGEDCLCMKTDTGEFVTLACTECIVVCSVSRGGICLMVATPLWKKFPMQQLL